MDAIFAEEDVPTDQRAFTPLDAELAKLWKTISRMKPAPPDADQWVKVKDKLICFSLVQCPLNDFTDFLVIASPDPPCLKPKEGS